MTQPEVVVVQRRLANYRVPLFELMRHTLAKSGARLRVLHGEPSDAERLKRDGGVLDWAEMLPTHYFLGGDICWQPFGRQARNADLVIVTQENRLLYNLWAMAVARPKRLAFWGHGRNMQSERPDGSKERFKRWTTSRVDWWFAYTKLGRELVEQAGFPGDRITVLNNAIDTSRLAAWREDLSAAEIIRLRAQLGLGPGPVGLFLGSLYSEKRLDFLIRASDAVRQRVAGFQLLIVGDGPDRGVVKQAAAERPWVKWLGARQGREKMAILGLGDVLLNPGAVGLGMLDSFVSGVPVITTACGLHGPEIAYLEHRSNGLVTPDDLSTFVDAVCSLLRDDQLAAKLRAGCAASAREFTLEHMNERFCEGILACLGRPARRVSP